MKKALRMDWRRLRARENSDIDGSFWMECLAPQAR